MKKAVTLLLSVILLTTAGCSNGKPTTPTPSATESKATVDRMEYEFYIESLNFFMDDLADAGEKETAALEKLNQAATAEEYVDFEELKKAYNLRISALGEFYDISCPENIKAEHEEFIEQIEKEKKTYELLLKQIYFEENKDKLTDSEKEEQTLVTKELNKLLAYDENQPTLWDLRNKAVKAANKYCD